MKREALITPTTPREKWYCLWGSIGLVLLCVRFIYPGLKFESIWSPSTLISATLLFAWIGFFFAEMAPQRRKKKTALFDLIWIFFGILALVSQGWKQIEDRAHKQLNQLIAIRNDSDAGIKVSAAYHIALITPNSHKFAGDKQLIPKLSAYSQQDSLFFDNPDSFFSKSTKKPNYLSDLGTVAFDSLSDRIAKRDDQQIQIEILKKKIKEEGTPEQIQLLGCLLVSLALGLRLAKAVSDMKDAICIQKPSQP